MLCVAGELGELQPSNLSYALSVRLDTLIVSGHHSLHRQANYACVNNQEQLDSLVKDRTEKLVVVAPRDQYAKYVFHDNIESTPTFTDLEYYKFDATQCSQQLLALALACWVGNPCIALFDFMLEPKKETPAIKAIFKIYPNTSFLFVKMRKGNKLTVFDDVPNLRLMDETQYLNFYNQYIKKK